MLIYIKYVTFKGPLGYVNLLGVIVNWIPEGMFTCVYVLYINLFLNDTCEK